MPQPRRSFDQPSFDQNPRSAVADLSAKSLERRLWGAGFAVLIFLSAIFFSASVWGQAAGFTVDKIPEALTSPTSIRAMEQARKEAPGRRDASPGSWPQWNVFSAYYNQYLFAKMTQPGELANLPAYNEDILKDLRRAQSSGATDVARAIVSWSSNKALALANGNYHPGVRINATLLLGSLSDTPAAGTRPPKPSGGTLSPLVQLYRSEKVPDGVRAAALIGLHRWTRYGLAGLSAPARTGIANMMLELANAPVPANRTPEGHAFLQRYALDILSALYTPELSEQITAAFVKLSTSPDAPDIISLYATARLPRLAALDKIQAPQDVAKAWTVNVASVFQSEADRLLAMDPLPSAAKQPRPVMPNATRGGMPGGMPGGMEMGMDMGMGGMEGGGMDMGMEAPGGMDMGMGMGGMDMGMGMGGFSGARNLQPPEILASRRRLIHALQSVRYGVSGSKTMDPSRTPQGLSTVLANQNDMTLEQLNEMLTSALEDVNDSQLITRKTFAAMLEYRSKEIAKLATHLGAPAPQEDEGPEVKGPAGFPGGELTSGFGPFPAQ